MDKNTKLTLNDLLAKKEQIYKNKIEYKDVFVESLGGCLTLKKIPLTKYYDIISNEGANDIANQIYLIYECCQILHQKDLQDAFGCAEPSDIVAKILNDNLADINKLVEEISGFYGISTGVDLKN